MLVHASSGFKHSLKGKIVRTLLGQVVINFRKTEILQDPAVLAKMSDTKASGEVKALENFYAILQSEPAKAFYGKKHVMKAAEAQAIETLLISDSLFR